MTPSPLSHISEVDLSYQLALLCKKVRGRKHQQQENQMMLTIGDLLFKGNHPTEQIYQKQVGRSFNSNNIRGETPT